MKIKMTKTRMIAHIGLCHEGQTIQTPNNLGQQLIAQGFAVQIKKNEPPQQTRESDK